MLQDLETRVAECIIIILAATATCGGTVQLLVAVLCMDMCMDMRICMCLGIELQVGTSSGVVCRHVYESANASMQARTATQYGDVAL